VGIVRGNDGVPLPGASASIVALARTALSDSTGKFVLAGLPVGEHQLVVRARGFAPTTAALQVPTNATLNVEVAMQRTATSLDPVVVSSVVQNQVSGIVVDSAGSPVSGVEIEVLGLRRSTTTLADGRFLLLDLDPGAYVLQFRATGYRVSQYSVRMVPQVDRDLTIRLSPHERGDRFTAEMAKQVAVEANLRRAWRSRGATSVSRDELERWENAPLAVALAGSSAGIQLRDVDVNCLLINGYESLTKYAGGTPFRTVRLRGVPTSVNSSVANANAAARPGTTGPRSVAWLSHFRASDVELVEVYPEGSDNSRTLFGRFPPSSGCGESGLVIWLKR